MYNATITYLDLFALARESQTLFCRIWSKSYIILSPLPLSQKKIYKQVSDTWSSRSHASMCRPRCFFDQIGQGIQFMIWYVNIELDGKIILERSQNYSCV
jgi:hypothetical protein